MSSETPDCVLDEAVHDLFRRSVASLLPVVAALEADGWDFTYGREPNPDEFEESDRRGRLRWLTADGSRP